MSLLKELCSKKYASGVVPGDESEAPFHQLRQDSSDTFLDGTDWCTVLETPVNCKGCDTKWFTLREPVAAFIIEDLASDDAGLLWCQTIGFLSLCSYYFLQVHHVYLLNSEQEILLRKIFRRNVNESWQSVASPDSVVQCMFG